MIRSDERSMSRSSQYASGVLIAGMLFLGLTATVHTLMGSLGTGLDRYIAMQGVTQANQIATTESAPPRAQPPSFRQDA